MTLEAYLQELDALGYDICEGGCEHLEGYFMALCRNCSATFAVRNGAYRSATNSAYAHPAIYLHSREHDPSTRN